jgi:hypothetical protein
MEGVWAKAKMPFSSLSWGLHYHKLKGVRTRWKKPQLFSGQCIGFLVLMQKNMISANKIMVSFQHLARNTIIGGH